MAIFGLYYLEYLGFLDLNVGFLPQVKEIFSCYFSSGHFLGGLQALPASAKLGNLGPGLAYWLQWGCTEVWGWGKPAGVSKVE